MTRNVYICTVHHIYCAITLFVYIRTYARLNASKSGAVPAAHGLVRGDGDDSTAAIVDEAMLHGG